MGAGGEKPPKNIRALRRLSGVFRHKVAGGSKRKMNAKEMAQVAVYNQQKTAGNKIMDQTLAAKFTACSELLVKLLAEDHGFFRFEVLAGITKGSFLWVHPTGIERLREATSEEVESQEIAKREAKVY